MELFNINNSFTDFVSGQVLLVDKPLKWTSFDVVKKIRYQIKHSQKLKKIKVGHAGTLDPLATGLLIICTGKATKTINEFQNEEKEYIAKFKFGSTTPSFDLETEIDKNYPDNNITKEKIENIFPNFLGKQKQLPPIFSAKLVNGERAYEKARKGENFDLQSCEIHISNLELLEFKNNEAKIKINCSKGTYIRALARDFGQALDSGAHLIALERTKIGKFDVVDAYSIDEIIKYFDLIKQNQNNYV